MKIKNIGVRTEAAEDVICLIKADKSFGKYSFDFFEKSIIIRKYAFLQIYYRRKGGKNAK